jgi:hypothetical protein
MSNTVIQIKYSNATSTPASLNVGELAYSFASGKLFTGNSTNAVLTIGGKYYTDLVDGATSANTVSTIVKRDSLGGFSATHVYASLYGNANTATALATPRYIKVSGDVDAAQAVFDGTANADITLELTNTGVTAGTYGGTTQIPTFAVDVDGRITSAANVAISTTLNTAADTGTDAIALATDTLTFKGGDGITTNMVSANSTVTIDVDNTVFRSTGGTISGDLAITGNLVVSGNTITQDVETMKVEDSLIQLAANNSADAVDIGFFGQYNSTGTKYSAFFRDATDGNYKLLTAGTEVPSAANSVNVAAFSTASLVANITGGTVSGLTADIAVADGGTGVGSFTAGQILVGNGTGALTTKSNVTQTATGSLAVANTITSLSFDAQTGGITAYTSQAIAIGASQITSGTLPIARGGTNQTSFTNGLVAFNGTSLATLPNTTYTQTGTLSAANTISSLTVDAYGRTTAATVSPIAIDASQITSGTLVTTRGGTGLSSFTDKGVFYASSTSAMSQVSSSTEGHLLTINASGAPTFAHLSGGTF